MSRPVLPRQFIKRHADLPRKFTRRLTLKMFCLTRTPFLVHSVSNFLNMQVHFLLPRDLDQEVPFGVDLSREFHWRRIA
jgi:hypothetical protein